MTNYLKKLQGTYDVKEAMREMKNECDEGIVRISSWVLSD